MAYQTGTVTDLTNLITVIQTFASANGFSISGNVIGDAGNTAYVRLTIMNTNFVKIEGAKNSAFTTDVCTMKATLYCPNTEWPFTYHLFYYANPKTIFCVVERANARISWLGFGTLIKGAFNYTGGNWFAAQVSDNVATTPAPFASGGTYNHTPGTWNLNNPDLFPVQSWNNTYGNGVNSYLYREIEGRKWGNERLGGDTVGQAPDRATPWNFIIQRTPNAWNSHAVLFPIRVMVALTPLWMDCGTINSIFSLRMDNYALGQMVTIGANQYKIFPVSYKNTANPSGVGGTESCIGFALLYDGP